VRVPAFLSRAAWALALGGALVGASSADARADDAPTANEPDAAADAGAREAGTDGATSDVELAGEGGADGPAGTKKPTDGAPPYEPAWCAPEFETLPGDVCFAPAPTSKQASRRTLVIFLHGLTQTNTTWQYSLQRGVAMFGKRLGYAVLAPKGMAGIGPGKKADTIAWPTAETERRAHEDAMLLLIEQAKEAIEKRDGAPFDEVFVMGFSNGAYYASSLALRGRLAVDGYAVFAGGSAPKGTERMARAIKNRVPVFVGVASRDDTAKKGRELAKLLAAVHWPHETSERPVGHVVADAQLERAVAYLRGKVDAKKGGAAVSTAEATDADDGATEKAPPKKTAKRGKNKPAPKARSKSSAKSKHAK